MTSEPSEEAISNFVSFTSTSREQAISFLKANDLDSNKAINAYFEDPTGPHTQTANHQNDSAYQIERSDAVPASPNLLPLSRPPSALNLKDSTHTAERRPPQTQGQTATTAESGNGLTLAEQEERQLQQAVAMSLNQNLGQQETGVTNTSQKKFSRATRDHYDEGDWGMTLFNSSTREIVISPDPTDRKRADNEPAFIRPSQDILYLSGLITILHSIPLSREALLLRNQVLSSYGHDPQWWNGQPINLPKIVAIHEAQGGDTDWDDIIHETQRLVAFLDSTERAFGSADALAGLKCFASYNSEGNISRFLESWQESAVRADPGNPLTTAFSSTAYKRPLYEYDTPIDKEFFVLEPFVDPNHGQTLYDVLDRAMWSDTPGEELDDVWLEHVADILVVKLESSDVSKPVDVKIPAAFYPDRYLASCRDIARDYRSQRLLVYKDILKVQDLIDHFSTSKKLSTRVTTRVILEKAAVAASTILPKGNNSGTSESTTLSGELTAKAQQLATDLREISKKIEGKLKELEERKEQALESLRSHSKFLTEPVGSPSEPPVHKYTLRGVCTEPHVTYVQRRVSESLQNATETETATTDAYQWWRISFSPEDAKTRQTESGQQSHSAPKNTDVIGYTARKVREVEVLRAAREESRNALLVYANSNAMNIKEEPAPVSLQAFVNADNKAFEEELQDSAENQGNLIEGRRLSREGGSWEQLPGTRPAFPSPAINEDEQQDPAGAAARRVNVFDYQVSSFEDESAESGKEMQERAGRPLLSRSATGTVQSSQDTHPPWSQ